MTKEERTRFLYAFRGWQNSTIDYLKYDKPSLKKRRLWAGYRRQFGDSLRFLGKNCSFFSCAGWIGDTFHYLTGHNDYSIDRETLYDLCNGIF